MKKTQDESGATTHSSLEEIIKAIITHDGDASQYFDEDEINKAKSRIQSLVEEGYQQSEMGKMLSVSSTLIYRYLHHSNIYAFWVRKVGEREINKKNDEKRKKEIMRERIKEENRKKREAIKKYKEEKRKKKQWFNNIKKIAANILYNVKKIEEERRKKEEERKRRIEEEEKKKYYLRNKILESYSDNNGNNNNNDNNNDNDNDDNKEIKDIYKKEAISYFLQVYCAKIVNTAYKESWTLGKTIEFRYKRPKCKYKLRSVWTIFYRYERAKNNKRKVSLIKLGQGTEINHASSVSKVINAVGLETLYGKRIRKKVALYQKQAIKRAFPLHLSNTDIAYFLGVPNYTVNQHFQRVGNRSFVKEKHLFKQDKRRLSYRDVSQIFEARDAGFSDKEIIELLDITKPLINYAKKNRKKLEIEIIDYLRIMYNNPNVIKPYRDLSLLTKKCL